MPVRVFPIGVAAVLMLAPLAAASARPVPRPIAPDPAATPVDADGPLGFPDPTGPICSTGPSAGPNVLTDCEGQPAPANETAIAVDPNDPLHMVASANDEQHFLRDDGSLDVVGHNRARVTFDGGATWTTYAIPYKRWRWTADPSVAFDANGTVYASNIAFDNGVRQSDVLVSRSSDGGRTWSKAVRVATAADTFGGASVFHDHQFIAAWGDGNVIITWVPYVFTELGYGGALDTVPLVASVSHDGGRHFSDPVVVSGSSPLCTGLRAANSCDQVWGNSQAVSPTGRILSTFYVTSLYTPDGATNLERDRWFSVALDPATGAALGDPVSIGLAYDGIVEHDYPVNVDGRQTLQDSQFRLLHQGNVDADPSDPTGRHFAVVWFDNRNGPRPVPEDPYAAVTNAAIIVSQTFTGGHNWKKPKAIPLFNDQFMPWATYDSVGRLRVGFFDRSYDPGNHRYGYTLATESPAGSLDFDVAQVTDELSQPTMNDLWFATTIDPAFPDATRFLGDYSAVAATGDRVGVYWTDMRQTACFLGVCGYGENTYYATMP